MHIYSRIKLIQLPLDGRQLSRVERRLETMGIQSFAFSSVRDANEIRIQVNVEAKSRAVFNLTYEELLVRRKGRYELIINIDPQDVITFN
jgi:hypothetical protein